MNAIPVHFSKTTERGLYILTVRERLFYAVIKRHYANHHYCGYLNLQKDEWFRGYTDTIIRNKHCITYEGIGSIVLTVPQDLLRTIPIQFNDFWIGVDYMNRDNVQTQDVIHRLENIATDIVLLNK